MISTSRTAGSSWRRLLAAGLLSVSLAAQASTERAPVEDFESTLIAAMQSSASGADRETRRQSLDAMVARSFDMGAIAREIIGRHWDGLTPSMREALTARLGEYAVAVLVDRFVGYSGERFEAQGQSELGPDHARVRSRFVGAGGRVTQLDYVVARAGNPQSRIVNVYFDGVSGTDIQRLEFEAFLRAGGADALLERLEALIADIGG